MSVVWFISMSIGVLNEEFNFRHDWNSLISDNPNLRMTHYSDKYFPDADDMVAVFVVVPYCIM